MKTIKENCSNEIEVKNSKFISYIYYIKNEQEIRYYLNEIKNIEKDASHYCYAYILNGNSGYSDDSEPSNTAGYPIYNVLEKQKLNYVLCIVVRYFGGKKLGAGGLVRAYTKATTEVLKKCAKIKLIEGYKIEIKADYTSFKKLENLLKNKNVILKDFSENIRLIVELEKSELDLISNYKYEIIEEILIKKDSN